MKHFSLKIGLWKHNFVLYILNMSFKTYIFLYSAKRAHQVTGLGNCTFNGYTNILLVMTKTTI